MVREIPLLLVFQLMIKAGCVQTEAILHIIQGGYDDLADYYLYNECGSLSVYPQSLILPECESYNSDNISIVIASLTFPSGVSTQDIFLTIVNYSLSTPALSGIQEQLTSRCQDVISFSYSYNSSTCLSDIDSCLASCPDCWLNSVTYLHSYNCSKEIFILIHTTCTNFSIPGTCIGHSKPKSTCCPEKSNQNNAMLIEILVPLLLILVVLSSVTSALTAYAVKTRHAYVLKCSTTELDTTCTSASYDTLKTVASSDEMCEALEKWKTALSACTLSSKSIAIGRKLGEGCFGVVYSGEIPSRIQDSTIQRIAIKSMKQLCSLTQLEDFLSEAATMSKFNHPNILKLEGVCFDTEDRLPFIVLPLMIYGDLKSFLVCKRNNDTSKVSVLPEGFSLVTLLSMCLDLANGMAYLAQQKFVHRDLAARNCMVDEKLGIKIADFGLSRDVHCQDYYRLTHKAMVPVKWLAIESLLDRIFNEKTDVWSFGIVCWEVFSIGMQPYCTVENCDIPDYLISGQRLKKPDLCPEHIYQEIVLKCWSASPDTRPSFAECVLLLQKQLKETAPMD